jgi:exopolyphosphatase/guanosine-5'-triphosphate,3'-diphosphate pyrophosphatase
MAELVAVVDLGSTAVRLLLARIVPGARYRVLVQERVATRLGGGAPATLGHDAVDETLRAVHRFFTRYSSRRRGPRIVAIATSAVRDAANRERLLGPLRIREGIDVQVLSARDEAQLGVDAVVNSLPFTHGIVADLGGASLQLSRVRARRIVASASVPLGAVRTTRRFLRHDPPRARELRAFRAEIRRQLDGAVPPAARGEVIVGLGGIVHTLASIHLRSHRGERKHRHALRLRQSDVTAIRERLERVSRRERRKIRGLESERGDIVLSGAIVIEDLMVYGGYLTLVVCTRGVRDGVLLRETFGRRE